MLWHDTGEALLSKNQARGGLYERLGALVRHGSTQLSRACGYAPPPRTAARRSPSVVRTTVPYSRRQASSLVVVVALAVWKRCHDR
eukprot:5353382-Prymnesium_polylepis.1